MSYSPRAILDNIHRRLFKFLWCSIKEKEGLYLVKWHKNAKPKKEGGWGIKNIYLFGRTFGTKSLWRCLMVPGLWHDVVQKKCLKKKYVVEWLREGKKNLKGMSNC